ncbi:MAG: hypothetical protein ABIJ05_00540 [Patescibacteria group bacterium]
MKKKYLIIIFIFTLTVCLSLIIYYFFDKERIKVGQNIHSTGKSERLQDISFVKKSPIPKNENNLKSIKGEVVDYVPDQNITIDYFENTKTIQIENNYTLFYKIYSDPRIINDLELSFEENYSHYIKIGKYVSVILKEQLRENSDLVAKKIFIWDPEN